MPYIHPRACEVTSVMSEAPWTVAHQAPMFMGLSRQEYWSGLPGPPRDPSHPWIELVSLRSLALASEFFTTSATHKGHIHSHKITRAQPATTAQLQAWKETEEEKGLLRAENLSVSFSRNRTIQRDSLNYGHGLNNQTREGKRSQVSYRGIMK